MTDTLTEISPDEVALVLSADPALAERDPELATALARARLHEARRLAKRYADATRSGLAKAFVSMLCTPEVRDTKHPEHHEAVKELARARCRYRAAGGKPVNHHFEDLLEPAELLTLQEQPAIFTCVRNQDYEGAIAAWNANPFKLREE